MPVKAILTIDGGEGLNDDTTFEVRPEVGDKISYWKNGREAKEAIVTALRHHQGEDGFVLVVEAKSDTSVYETRGMLRV